MIHIVDLETMTEIDRQTLQSRFPTTSFPSDEYLTDSMLAEFGCATFTIDDKPECLPFFTLQCTPITKDADGLYRVHWNKVDVGIDQCKGILISMVNQQKQIALNSPVIFDGFRVPLSTDLVVLLRESLILGVTATVRCADEWLSVSNTNASNLASLISGKLLAISANESAHYVAIGNLTDPEAARNYDVTSGWPQ